MNTKTLVLFLLATLLITSCNFSFSYKNNMYSKEKTIGGVNYSLINYSECNQTQVFFSEKVEFKNRISFHGMGQAIEMVIPSSDFERKIDLHHRKSIEIDSVSFLVSNQKDKIDLIYYLKLGKEYHSVAFALQKDNGDWKLE